MTPVWIQGECPRGCGKTLFVGEGGYVTCSWIECPEPDAAHKALVSRLQPDHTAPSRLATEGRALPYMGRRRWGQEMTRSG